MKKELLSKKQFILLINGPSCGGKSTVSNILTELYGGIFKAKSDKIKWLISDYNPSEQRGVVHEMTIEMLRVALKHGLSVLKEGAFYEPEKFIKISEEFKIPLFIVNVSAPKDVLRDRFQERINKNKERGEKSNTTLDRFEKIYDMYIDSKIESPLEFDSSLDTPNDIADKIVTHIRRNI